MLPNIRDDDVPQQSTTVLPRERLDEMDAYRRYMMEGGTRRTFVFSVQRGTCRYPEQDLKELDATVASVGKRYRRGEDENDSRSVSSHTICTQDGHSIYTNRHLIDNMQLMNRGRFRRPDESQSHASVRSTRTGRSSRQSRSQARSKRGSSLERIISQTILKTADAEPEDAHFEVRPTKAENLTNSSVSTEFILRDLIQVSAIIEAESSSHRSIVSDSSRSSRRRSVAPANTSLLPLMASPSSEERENQEVAAEERLPSNLVVKPDVEQVDPDPAVIYASKSRDPPSSKLSWPEASKDPFGELDRQDDFWIYSPKSEATLTPQKPSKSRKKYSILEDSDDGWTSFDVNPFHQNVTFDNSSVGSPSSIVDFANFRDKRIRNPFDGPWSERCEVETKASI